MRGHHRGPLPPKGQRSIDKVATLIAEGKSNAEIAAALDISRHSVRQYRYRLSPHDRPRPLQPTKPVHVLGTCSGCGLRLFGDEEVPGQCNSCLPASATAFLGRRGEPEGMVW